jgi:hypothetical protein
LPKGVDPRFLLEDYQPEAVAVQFAELLLDLVDPGLRAAGDRNLLRQDSFAGELFDRVPFLEIVWRVDQLVELLQRGEREIEEICIARPPRCGGR